MVTSRENNIRYHFNFEINVLELKKALPADVFFCHIERSERLFGFLRNKAKL